MFRSYFGATQTDKPSTTVHMCTMADPEVFHDGPCSMGIGINTVGGVGPRPSDRLPMVGRRTGKFDNDLGIFDGYLSDIPEDANDFFDGSEEGAADQWYEDGLFIHTPAQGNEGATSLQANTQQSPTLTPPAHTSSTHHPRSLSPGPAPQKRTKLDVPVRAARAQAVVAIHETYALALADIKKFLSSQESQFIRGHNGLQAYHV